MEASIVNVTLSQVTLLKWNETSGLNVSTGGGMALFGSDDCPAALTPSGAVTSAWTLT